MEEFKLGALKSKFDPRDFKWEKMSKLVTAEVLPEEYSTENNLLEVRNQGNVGSCVAMTCATIKDFQEKKDSKIEEYTSPRFIYSLRKNKPESGMYPRNAMSILLNNGTCLESEFPYDEITEFDSTPDKKLIDLAYKNSIKSYAKINSIEGLKKALYKNGPCLITVIVYNYWEHLWKPRDKNDANKGGHAMTVVGYNKEGFIIRNSWGSNWNKNGHTILPYSDWKWVKEVWTTVDEKTAKLYKDKTRWVRSFTNFLWENRILLSITASILALTGAALLIAFKFIK